MHAEMALLCLSHIEVHESEDCVTCRGGSCCETLDDVLLRTNRTIRHLSEAEPSADLREALLNTCYITVLIKLETFNDSNKVAELLVQFLFFLKSSGFTYAEDLYLHHRSIYDRIMRKRIVDFSLDFEPIVGLALAGLRPNIGLFNFNEYFAYYLPAVEGGLLSIYQTLYFRPLDYFSDSSLKLLTEFLTDPGRARRHALDGPKCALITGFFLDCFIPPCSKRHFFLYLDIYECSRFLSQTGTLLSKASHSDDLVARLNHPSINCEFFTAASITIEPEDYITVYVDKTLCTLIKEIGDYLTRVVGSVPIDLKITLRVNWLDCHRTYGPFYYEWTRTV